MMVMPGMKLTHPPTPLPWLAWVLFPSGGTWAAIYCVYKGPRSKQKRKLQRRRKCHTQETKRGRAHTQSQSSPLGPWPCAIGSQETEIARTYTCT